MKIVHQNIRRLFTNFEGFTATSKRYEQVDIITLSETHITEHVKEEIFKIQGYNFLIKADNAFNEIIILGDMNGNHLEKGV